MSGHTDDVVRAEQIDSAFAEGVRACLQRLYAANVRTDEHRAAWEDCEALWRTRTDQVIASRVERKSAPVPSPTPVATKATLDQISTKAREWAAHYSEASDGRNTFILFAEWIETLAPSNSHADLVKALEEIGKQLTMGELIAEYGEDYLGDPEAGYDAIIMVARAALATLTARKVG